jgi:hypothetical protein
VDNDIFFASLFPLPLLYRTLWKNVIFQKPLKFLLGKTTDVIFLNARTRTSKKKSEVRTINASNSRKDKIFTPIFETANR